MLLNLICYLKKKKSPHFSVNQQFLTKKTILFIACRLVLSLSRHQNKPMQFLLLVHFFYLTVLAEIFDLLSMTCNYCCLKNTSSTLPKRKVKYFNLLLNTLYFIDEKAMIMYSVKPLTSNVCLLYLSLLREEK